MIYRPLAFLWLISATLLRAGVVEDWNEAFLNAVRKETPPPCLVSRNLPIFHLAIHRAVKAATLAKLNEQSQTQAAHLAARATFLSFFPSESRFAEVLDAKIKVGEIPESVRALFTDAVQCTLTPPK